jgi:hypothetical protein
MKLISTLPDRPIAIDVPGSNSKFGEVLKKRGFQKSHDMACLWQPATDEKDFRVYGKTSLTIYRR